MRKETGVNIIASISLMVSITLFVGSLLYLAFYNPFNPPTNQPSNNIIMNNQVELLETEIIENKSLKDALHELQEEGCNLIFLESRLYLDNPQYISYDKFTEKAIESKMVIISQSEDNDPFLVVLSKDTEWIWIP